jgi:hypothetical protein
VIVAVALLVVIGIFASVHQNTGGNVKSNAIAASEAYSAASDAAAVATDVAAMAAAESRAAGTASESAADMNGTQKPEAETWSYSTDEDKVRGSKSYFARTTITNSIHQDFPYDNATTMTMTVRNSRSQGSEVVLTVSSGQLMCPSYDDSSETIFVDGAQSFITKLKHAKHVVIEKTLYQAGNPQFEFSVSGLKWDH